MVLRLNKFFFKTLKLSSRSLSLAFITSVSDKEKRRGRKGYWVVLIDRLLVYLALVGIFSNRGLRTHLENHETTVDKVLGFKTIPHRTTISRWRRKCMLIFQIVNSIGDLIQLIVPTVIEIVDSTLLEDPSDPDARKGKTSKGWFKGFKLHFLDNS